MNNATSYTEKDLLPILFDIAQHTATREELEKVSNKLDAKIDKLDAKIDKVANKLDAKIDKVAGELRSDITATRDKSDSQFKWLLGLILISILLPIAQKFII